MNNFEQIVSTDLRVIYNSVTNRYAKQISEFLSYFNLDKFSAIEYSFTFEESNLGVCLAGTKRDAIGNVIDFIKRYFPLPADFEQLVSYERSWRFRFSNLQMRVPLDTTFYLRLDSFKNTSYFGLGISNGISLDNIPMFCQLLDYNCISEDVYKSILDTFDDEDFRIFAFLLSTDSNKKYLKLYFLANYLTALEKILKACNIYNISSSDKKIIGSLCEYYIGFGKSLYFTYSFKKDLLNEIKIDVPDFKIQDLSYIENKLACSSYKMHNYWAIVNELQPDHLSAGIRYLGDGLLKFKLTLKRINYTALREQNIVCNPARITKAMIRQDY